MPIVPDVKGLSLNQAVANLTAAGLQLGRSSVESSATVQAGNVKQTGPPAGATLAPPTSLDVDLVISSGPPSVSFFQANWLSLAFSTLAGILIVFLGASLITGALLERLASQDIARGVITFLIAVTAAALFIIMAVSTIVDSGGPNPAERFDRGKQILTMLVGILGTIVGFYMAPASHVTPPPSQATTNSSQGAANSSQAAPNSPPVTLKISDLKAVPTEVREGQTFTISGALSGGKGPYKYSIKFNPALDVPPIAGAPDPDGKFAAPVKALPPSAKEIEVDYTVDVTDADGKAVGSFKGDKKIKLIKAP
jgi:hypothetical protein